MPPAIDKEELEALQLSHSAPVLEAFSTNLMAVLECAGLRNFDAMDEAIRQAAANLKTFGFVARMEVEGHN